MSCRTGSNSVVTSIVQGFVGRKGHKNEDEKLVQSKFHDLRNEGAEQIRAGAAAGVSLDAHPDDRGATVDPTSPADPAEVVEWLRGQASMVRNNDALSENKRQQWGAKLDAAVAEVRRGEGPDRATFYAWQRLLPEVDREIRSLKHHGRMGSLRQYPTLVTREGVEESLQYWSELLEDEARVRAAGGHAFRDTNIRAIALRTRARQLPRVTQQCQELVRAYDQTAAGQAALAGGATDHFDAVFPGGRQERLTGPAPGSQPLTPEELTAALQEWDRNTGAPDPAQRSTAFRGLVDALRRHPGYATFQEWSDQEAASQKHWRRLLRQSSNSSGDSGGFDVEAVRRGFFLITQARVGKREHDGELTREQGALLLRSIDAASRSAREAVTRFTDSRSDA